MTNEMTSTVRLVRCPKCQKVLPELADFAVYKCGGCDTVLQAKSRKNDVKNTGSNLQKMKLAYTDQFEQESCRSGQMDECSSDQNNGSSQNENGDCNRELPGNIDPLNEISSSCEVVHQENDETSPVDGANSEADENNDGVSNLRSSRTDNILAMEGQGSIITAECLVNENISLDTICNEQLEQSQESVLHGFDHAGSAGTLEATEFINPSSELSGTLRDVSKSPTTRSSHAYDGSVSSYDGADDQVLDQHVHLHERTFKAADFVGSEERRRRDKFQVTNMMSSNSDMQHHARNFLSVSSNKKHYTMDRSFWASDELLEPKRHGHPVGNWMRLDRDEFPSGASFYRRSSQAGYENGGPSNHGHMEFQRSSSFHSHDMSEYPEQEKMKLLRMVHELETELYRMNIVKGKANGRVPTGVSWKDKQTSTFHSHEALEEIYHDLNRPIHPRRSRQGNICPQQSRLSRMPFSGEATSSRLQVDCSCSHCCAQEWHCSVPLRPAIRCCNRGLCRVHPAHNYYSPYGSCPPSPQQYVDRDFSLWGRDTKSDDQRHKEQYRETEFCSWGRDTMADDQRHKNHEVKKLYLREKQHFAKRHFRPIAGGAPFIACYRCSKLLQLPADFLLFKRRCHRLRCDACSEVLKFSLQNSTQIVPYRPSALAPPPSEVDDSSDAINRKNLSSTCHTNDCPHADPVSCSDDYGLSFCKSCSTEGEPLSLTPPFHARRANADDGKAPSGSSSEPMEARKKLVLKQSLNKDKNPMETHESTGPSSSMSNREKFSSEIEEMPPKTGLPLHHLMGYSSPSKVIYGSGAGTSSYYPGKP